MALRSIPRWKMERYCKTKFKEFGMTNTSIHAHILACRHLATFMEHMGYLSYTEDVGKEYCEYLINEYQSDNPPFAKSHYLDGMRIVRRLNESFDNIFNPHPLQRTRNVHLIGDFGEVAKQCIENLSDNKVCPNTIRKRTICLGRLSMFFHHKGVNLNNITRQDVAQLIDYRRKNNFDSLAIDKMFFRYLYKNKFIQTDFTGLFKNVKPLQSVKPIQYYSELEIEQIENSIDRTTAFGKQDYAVILLASRLGLRASDIAELSFSDINWLKCEIRKVQYKTQRTVVLPLLEDVGNALLDYIKNARPQVENQRVFITIHHPHRAFLSSRVSNIVRKVVQGSGVVTKGRPKGSHSLRHSLATNLISKGTGLPVLSDILGHSTTESTKVYLGISLQSLLECSLDVPLVNENFFKQKGGYFYG